MRFHGLNQTQIEKVNEYVAACVACGPDEPVPAPPNEKVSWLTFWCQVELLRKTRPYIFWVAILAIGIIVPVQLIALLVINLQKML